MLKIAHASRQNDKRAARARCLKFVKFYRNKYDHNSSDSLQFKFDFIMSKIVFALLLVISWRAAESFRLSIINGKPTEIVQFPWQAVFIWRSYFMCGAAVICEKLVCAFIS